MITDAQFDAFLEDYDVLLQIEEQLQPFNIFEAMNADKDELKHSAFLAFLLNPNQKHGIGEEFLRRFLFESAKIAQASGRTGENILRPSNVLASKLSGTTVRTEEGGIDVLITNDANKFIVVIENKINAGETNDQLIRYHAHVEKLYGGWDKLYLFLSPNKRAPSFDAYHPIAYELIQRIAQQVLTSKSGKIPTDVAVMIKHYFDLLGRNSMSENSVRDTAIKLYTKHKEVFEYIISNRPDKLHKLRELASSKFHDWCCSREDIKVMYTTTWGVDFAPVEWSDNIKLTHKVDKDIGLVTYFNFNFDGRFRLRMYIGPGDDGLRKKLWDLAKSHGSPFNPKAYLEPSWAYIGTTDLVGKKKWDEVMESESEEEFSAIIDESIRKIANQLEHAIPAFKSIVDIACTDVEVT